MSQTLYYEFSGIGGPGRTRTAVYLPDAFDAGGGTVDMILYLQGIKSPPIDEYLADRRFPLREQLNDSGGNLVLVAPTLGPRAEGGALETGPDRYIASVLESLTTSLSLAGKPLSPGRLVLCAHSGGGWTMLNIHKNLKTLRADQCWGFDCLYYPSNEQRFAPRPYTPGDDSTLPPGDAPELQWARSGAELRVFYWGTEIRSENLRKLAAEAGATNILVERARVDEPAPGSGAPSAHDLVPRTHLPGLLADFLS